MAAGLHRGDPGPTDAHVAAVLAAVRTLGGGRPGQVPDRLTPHREQIATWLGEGLRLTKIRLRAHGVTVPYSSLHRFARAHLGFGAPTLTVRVAEPPPGEAAEVDFGLLGLWFDPDRERRRRVYGLLVTLCFSRYAFLAITLRQDLTAVLDGLESAWVFFGGVVKRLVEDNLKPVITRADRYTPGIDRVFLEYAQYRGFVVDPALVRHATGKPKVGARDSLLSTRFLPRRDLPRPGRATGARRPLVPGDRRRPRARHHTPSPSRRVRDGGAADPLTPRARAL
jgi:hypothetical protein